ncbi:UDP-N-acetylmuramoyl-L-alanyl-D-glutamate--2,6-diaminopimelate ligase [Endozoicomonadaceae bacterium StTr2]
MTGSQTTGSKTKCTVDKLLLGAGLQSAGDDRLLTDLAIDSRQVTPGSLFLAMPGETVDGRRYIKDAIQRGAIAVLAESGELPADLPVPIYSVAGLRPLAGKLANCFFNEPSRSLKVLGVTGTNGKSSTCHFLGQLLQLADQPCALMGTLGQGFPGSLVPMSNTTADVISIQRYLYQLQQAGTRWLAMEVSSHGLEQGRVTGVEFSTAVFTNLSRDHLDYHGSMDEYARAKAQLFSAHKVHRAVINRDDARAEEMLNAAAAIPEKLTFSLQGNSADLVVTDLHCSSQGMQACIETPWGRGEIMTPLLGRFNLSNLLAAIGTLLLEGLKLDDLIAYAGRLETVPGRLQSQGGNGKPLVIVDYAHTPDALVSALSALRDHSEESLTCVFGCGGDRDRGKRPLMLQAALQHADKVVLTSDNPRTEDPEQIINDALQGLSLVDQQRVRVCVDRREAIASAVAEADASEIVLVAGKGHEDYQEINGQRFSFDDRDEVKTALERYEHAG